MRKEEIRNRIRQNLVDSHIVADTVRVQQTPYSGWIIAVVSDDFDGLSPALRRKKILGGLENASVEWADLLTPSELPWSGGLPSDESAEQLPLWPESLARGMTPKETIRFPSDEDDDLEPPFVVTFYSLRGGVGRSSALAHTARLLAEQRKKVLCVDMDFEAPGLVSLFGCEEESGQDKGVVRLLLDLDQEDDPDISRHLIRVTEEHDLYVLPAGNVGPNYARQLRLLDPNAWYHEEQNPLRLLMKKLRKDLPFIPDAILIDARTGITPMSGPLLFELADMAIIHFFPHPQSRRGTELLVRGLLSSTTYRDADPRFTPEVRFIASPIPAIRDILIEYERRAWKWVSEWLSRANGIRGGAEYIDEQDITQIVPYREEIAASDTAAQAVGIEPTFETVRDWIVRFLPSAREQDIKAGLEDLKPLVLEELSFSAGTAESQEDFLEHFVQTEIIRDAVSGKIPLVLGRKGSGKTAIFRWLPDQTSYFKVVLKQAWLAESFRSLLKSRPGGERLAAGNVDDWSGEDVRDAWTVLVGERMKGGKTAFTRNWVWNRLADANNNHAPRHLIQLFHEAIEWEREKHRQMPYDRSVIRPRGLIECLAAVSEQALFALEEEFRELDPLLNGLKRIARSPFNAADLDSPESEMVLAREVGLLEVYEEKGDEIQRFRIPDIYRLALGMTRKGQA